MALREVARVRRCQSFGETDDGGEVGAEAGPSLEYEKDEIRTLGDARFGMGIGTGTGRGLGTYAGGDAGNDESELEDSPYPAWACEPERRNSTVFSFSRSRAWTSMDVESEVGMIDVVSSLIPCESSNLGCTERVNW